MIITITKDDGQVVYDTTMIEDENARANANMSISKIGTLNVLVEALNFASGTHQNNLELLLQSAEEAIVETPEGDEEVVEEDLEDES
jgi:ribonuclease PH|tara:strand:- start:117 stop:377 length:261 start_codon:yes stop_codon:yes gene_type:complete